MINYHVLLLNPYILFYFKDGFQFFPDVPSSLVSLTAGLLAPVQVIAGSIEGAKWGACCGLVYVHCRLAHDTAILHQSFL